MKVRVAAEYDRSNNRNMFIKQLADCDVETYDGKVKE
jgi:hypothetical protein|tara:strand:- start:1009 stop:1119 length:111 start_codon:yes stop_codon:yes gene_type:complete